jgi:dTDP-4-dehydrorhamnose reductase
MVAPDVIVNAAAYTAVDKAESEPEHVRLINALAPAVLASEAAKLGAWLVHYSTDYVFDGSGDRPWEETDPVGPLNVYGATKLEGEAAIISSGCSYLIFRTSWVFAARGENFAKKILRLAQERDRLTIVDDQVGAPTGAELLADVAAHAIRMALQHPELTGLYHLVATGETSWCGYARFVLDFTRQAGIRLKTAPEDLVPVPSDAFPSPARRPNNSRLNTEKLGSAFGLKLPPWQTGVARMLTEILENHHDPA